MIFDRSHEPVQGLAFSFPCVERYLLHDVQESFPFLGKGLNNVDSGFSFLLLEGIFHRTYRVLLLFEPDIFVDGKGVYVLF